MIKSIRAAVLISVLVLLASCSGKVRYTLSQELTTARPYTVAVLPVIWVAEETDYAGGIKRLMRTMSLERLRALNYGTVSIEEVDKHSLIAEKIIPKVGNSTFVALRPEEAAKLLDVDTILYIKLTEWDEDRFVTYVSLKMAATFELYSATGNLLWQAEYSTSESDIRLDKESMELAVIRTYEPRIQRFVDAVFSTLPRNAPRLKKERYFDWLP